MFSRTQPASAQKMQFTRLTINSASAATPASRRLPPPAGNRRIGVRFIGRSITNLVQLDRDIRPGLAHSINISHKRSNQPQI
jgi:hypothetical protein